ncbi:Fc receptor-like A isoform X4 [Carlito syrichta]|uniref:Fc receptor-like A isoform X4 n=1 Tax=Carlito syrichta TaxID=1868482 RepID=A0A1U7URP9_CARSF|nr:Fc receptor-like A isoform X4 [Carlito syrichta]
MLKKISVGFVGDINRIAMKLGCVLMAWAFYLLPAMFWADQMLMAAGCPAELFPVPVLRAAPSAEPQEGNPVTLSCQTKLPLQRLATRLLFTFYKDGQTVRSRSLSSEFQVLTASEEHSGSYWCEAATEDNQVWKQSPQLEIRVQGPFSSTASPTLNPAPQKSAAPGTTSTNPPKPLPPLSTPSSEDPGFSSPLGVTDLHLHYQMGILLKHMQDVRVLLGHLVMELRELSGRGKPGSTKAPAQQK